MIAFGMIGALCHLPRVTSAFYRDISISPQRKKLVGVYVVWADQRPELRYHKTAGAG